MLSSFKVSVNFNTVVAAIVGFYLGHVFVPNVLTAIALSYAAQIQ